MKPQVAVIGANGYIGRHLVRALQGLGCAVVPVGHRPESIDHLPGYVPLDLRHLGSLPEPLKQVQVVYLCSGATGTLQGFTDYQRFIELNEVGLIELLTRLGEAKQHLTGPRRVVLPSTRLVYRGVPNTPLSEEAELAPLSVYAVSKLAAERYLALFCRHLGLEFTITRICVPYGSAFPGALSYGTLLHFLRQAAQGGPLTVYGQGEQRRTLTHITDVAHMFGRAGLVAETANGIFNIGGPDVLSIREVADKIAARFDLRVVSRPWPKPSAALESGDTIFDASRLEAILGNTYTQRFEPWLERLPEPTRAAMMKQ
ncbi:MAG: NAD(P)-dependent oxidoreductase [Myxococcota bacterium]